ncbi:MAG TPA: ABC transporter ATP-binding protein [Myxococcales bacterium]|nr:ABC transporter ATP-binding protein [Myxococcales bacterium]
MPILLVDAVSKSFGAVKVTDGLSFAVAEGETLGILGPNGAGKTTLFNLVTGELRPDAGRIEFRGEDVGELPPHRRCRMGMGRAYQIPKPFGAMTVFENLVTAAAFGGERREKDTYDDAVEILRQTGLLAKGNVRAGGLGLLDRKRLELARALATRPRLLLLDEIAGGLTEHEARQLVAELRRIKSAGVTMLWIEHVVHALFAVADRLLVVHSGRKLAEGEPSRVLADPEVQRVYLGHVA